VDARHKAGHDVRRLRGLTKLQPILLSRTAVHFMSEDKRVRLVEKRE